MRSIIVVLACLISAAVGAGIDHYWDALPSSFNVWEKLPAFVRSAPAQPQAAQHATAASLPGRDEVLGDRVRCDVRYQELKIPETEYRSFFDKCMGQ